MPEINPYAKFLDHRPLETVLSATPVLLASLAQSIGPEKIAVSPAPRKWSPAEILCHLADCEIAFAFRLRQTLAEEHHTLQPFDQDLWADPYSSFGPDKGAEQAIATFTALRNWNMLLITSTLPTAAEKPVTHPERGAMTFRNLVETMAGHDLNHIQQLQKLAGHA